MSEAAPDVDQPFALWTIFHGLPRWYFARGFPPTLARSRGWNRGVRTTVLFGAMGLASSWVTTLWLAIERQLEGLLSFGGEGTLVFAPGVSFGLLVLLPLSRWIGRGWILSGLLVPISTAVYFVAVTLYLKNAFNPDDFPNGFVGGMAAGAWGGFGVSLWFIRLHRPRSWWLVPWVTIIGGLATWGMTIAPNTSPPTLPFGLDVLTNLLGLNLLFSPFQTMVAMALGARLWWDEAALSHASPRPAANTAETSTANPGSHTDVAVSPDWNSP